MFFTVAFYDRDGHHIQPAVGSIIASEHLVGCILLLLDALDDFSGHVYEQFPGFSRPEELKKDSEDPIKDIWMALCRSEVFSPYLKSEGERAEEHVNHADIDVGVEFARDTYGELLDGLRELVTRSVIDLAHIDAVLAVFNSYRAPGSDHQRLFKIQSALSQSQHTLDGLLYPRDALPLTLCDAETGELLEEPEGEEQRDQIDLFVAKVRWLYARSSYKNHDGVSSKALRDLYRQYRSDLERTDDCLRDFSQRVLKKNAEILLSRGFEYFTKKKYAQARKSFQGAAAAMQELQLEQTDLVCFYHQALCELYLGRYGDAKETFKKHLSAHVEKLGAVCGISKTAGLFAANKQACELSKQKLGKLYKMIDRCLLAQRSFIRTKNNALQESELVSPDYYSACGWLEEIIDREHPADMVNENLATYHEVLADCFAALKRFEPAVDHMKKSIEIRRDLGGQGVNLTLETSKLDHFTKERDDRLEGRIRLD